MREGDIDTLVQRMQALESHSVEPDPAGLEPPLTRGLSAYSPASAPYSADASGTAAEETKARNKMLLKTLPVSNGLPSHLRPAMTAT